MQLHLDICRYFNCLLSTRLDTVQLFFYLLLEQSRVFHAWFVLIWFIDERSASYGSCRNNLFARNIIFFPFEFIEELFLFLMPCVLPFCCKVLIKKETIHIELVVDVLEKISIPIYLMECLLFLYLPRPSEICFS